MTRTLEAKLYVIDEERESLGRFLARLGERARACMRADELAAVWYEANRTRLTTGWVMRRLRGHRKRCELPNGLRPK